MGDTSTTVPALIRAAAHGDPRAPSQIFPLIYEELRRVARNYMRRERSDHSLQPTALVHEAYIRLFKGHERDEMTRTHFFRLSARAMREVLVEHARARLRLKRSGEQRPLTFIDNLAASPLSDDAVLRLNEALEELDKLAPRATQIVEMRFFAGMTEDEIAHALKISGTTVKRDWTFARAWLHGRLKPVGDR